MIVLHTLGGDEFAINSELIERIDPGPTQTNVLSATGHTWIVRESMDDVIRLREQAQATKLSNALLVATVAADSHASAGHTHEDH